MQLVYRYCRHLHRCLRDDLLQLAGGVAAQLASLRHALDARIDCRADVKRDCVFQADGALAAFLLAVIAAEGGEAHASEIRLRGEAVLPGLGRTVVGGQAPVLCAEVGTASKPIETGSNVFMPS